jgi:L,D-transpeptidase catalytic domain
LHFFILRITTAVHNGSSGNLTDDPSAMTFFEHSKECPLIANGRRPRIWTALSVALLSFLAFGAGGEPAAARGHGWFFSDWDSGWHGGGRAVRHRHFQAPRESEPRADFKKPAGPLYAVVSLADQHVTFYDANGEYAQGLVSTGVPGHPTPAGIFTILEKERWHRSNIYSGAPMPFMQRLAWTGVAMHEGAVFPGHTASHGCIRMQAAFARQMFAVTTAGQRVIISPQEVTPADIANPHLPAPAMQPMPAEALQAKPVPGKATGVEPVALDPQAAAEAKPLNPLDYAKALKAAAAAKAAGAAATKKNAFAALDGKIAAARLAARDFDAADYALKRAKQEAEEAARISAQAQGGEAIQKAAERKTAADAKLSEAEAKEASDKEVLALQTSIREADAAAIEAAAAARQAQRRLEPVSMFISRKTGRLYVRQANEHLFDVPVTIRDPERPLGTHLFIATRPAEDGASLHWVSLTPPAAVEITIRPRSSRHGRRFFPEEDTGAAPAFPETASRALDRIEIPEEAMKRISELLWAGSTLIVSDVGMSGEGRYPMDFMILEQTRIRVYD